MHLSALLMLLTLPKTYNEHTAMVARSYFVAPPEAYDSVLEAGDHESQAGILVRLFGFWQRTISPDDKMYCLLPAATGKPVEYFIGKGPRAAVQSIRRNPWMILQHHRQSMIATS
jgi:hypothetical protein